MIGNPFCTIKVFLNFHTKNRLAQVRHAFFDKLARKRPAQILKKTIHLKKRYSKTIKGQKRVWIAFGVTGRAAKRFMRPGQKKGGTNEKKRGSGTSGSHLFAGGVCSIRSCASGRDSDPDRDFVPGIPRGLPFCLLYRKAAGAFGAAP